MNISNMAGNNNDWVAIYPAGSSNDWDNVVTWRYTKGMEHGNINLGFIQAGSYAARAFFNNSYILEAHHKFTVVGKQVQHTSIRTQKEQYNAGESITVTVANMPGNNLDWVAIYPTGSSNDWDNVIAWKYTSGIKYGNINLGSLQAGAYQARVFFNNSFTFKASHNFTVNGVVGGADAKIFIIGDSTVHNANHGEMGWGTQLGNYMKHPDNVYNRVRAGASSKSYKPASNGHRDWVSTKSLIRSVNIDNGANDVAPDAARHTEPGRGNSYYNELKVYVNEARALGVTPVLITPPKPNAQGSTYKWTIPSNDEVLSRGYERFIT